MLNDPPSRSTPPVGDPISTSLERKKNSKIFPCFRGVQEHTWAYSESRRWSRGGRWRRAANGAGLWACSFPPYTPSAGVRWPTLSLSLFLLESRWVYLLLRKIYPSSLPNSFSPLQRIVNIRFVLEVIFPLLAFILHFYLPFTFFAFQFHLIFSLVPFSLASPPPF